MDIKNEVLSKIRIGIVRFEQKNASGDYKIPDASLSQFIEDSMIILSTVDAKLPEDVKRLAIKLLAQHLCLMLYDDTSSLNLPGNSESWSAKTTGLQLDQTAQGQMFKEIMSKYTDKFESADDLSKTPQHYIKIFS